MAGKKKQYKITGVPTPEKVEKYDEDRHIFYRFHNPYQRLTCRSCSWGMIFQSKAEAIRDCGMWNMTPDEAILPGKSCVNKLSDLRDYTSEFSEDDIVLVFYGYDTGVEGHDGEYVATYGGKVEAWTYDSVIKYFEETK